MAFRSRDIKLNDRFSITFDLHIIKPGMCAINVIWTPHEPKSFDEFRPIEARYEAEKQKYIESIMGYLPDPNAQGDDL